MTVPVTDPGTQQAYPLTPLQHGMLVQALLEPAAGLNFQQVVCRLRERVDAARLERAWTRVVRRHDALRTRFRWAGLPDPVQEPVAGAAEFTHEQADGGGEERLARYLDEDRARGFDLSAPPLRFRLFRLAEDDWALAWSFHHIVIDARAGMHVLDEVFALYDAAGGEPDPHLPGRRPFRAHVAWLRGRDPSADEAYWTALLGGMDAPVPVPALRHAPRDPAAEPASGTVELRLPPRADAALRALKRVHGVNLNLAVQGAWALLLARYTGRDEAVFGLVRGGRGAGPEGTDGVVGPLLNTVPMRVPVPPPARVIDWLKALGERNAPLRHHEMAALTDIVRWSGLPRGTALFDTLLSYQPASFEAAFRGRGPRWQGRSFRILRRSGFPLSVAVYGEEPVRVTMDYDAARFDGESADRLLRHFARLLEALAADPSRRLSALDPLDAAERRGVARAGNRTDAPYRAGRCVHRLFAEQAARTPGAAAVLFGDERLTYREMDGRSDVLARRLRRRGAMPETRVALALEPGPEMVAWVLAAWKAGGAFVPIDPATPPERTAFLLRDCGAGVMVAPRRLLASLPPHSAAALASDEEDDEADGEAADGGAPAVTLAGEAAQSLAYVIYTSGSTGTPKGVGVPHRALANHLLGAVHALAMGPQDVGIAQAAYTFDKWLLEVFAPLLSGGRVRLVAAAELADPAAVLAALAETTILYAVPAFLRQLLEAAAARGGHPLASLRLVGTGGDRAPADLLARARHALRPGAELRVVYGPTETTVVCTSWTVPADGRAEGYPVGSPLPGQRAYVCDGEGRLVPPGVAGELCIGGKGVARGYLARPAMTADRFVPDPFGGRAGARLYRTGDRARRRADGTLEYLGRLDEQVKVRGFRIEPGEVEAALRQCPGVSQCLVCARADAAGDERLVAYVVGHARPEALRAELRRTLPRYLVPDAFVPLAALPLARNGKVDRAALPTPAPAETEAYAAPRTAVEATLAAIWAEVLGVERVGVDDDFFALGGHSLVATRIVSRVRQALDGEIGVAALFRAPTIAGMAPLLSARGPGAAADTMPAESPHRLLSLLHELPDEELDRLLAAQP